MPLFNQKLFRCAYKHLAAGFLTVLLFALISEQELKAQGPPIHTDTPILLGMEGRALMGRAVYNVMTPGGAFPADSDAMRMRTAVMPVMLPYNITSEWQVAAGLPLIHRRFRENGQAASSFGIGDVSLLVKRSLVQADGPQRTFRITGKAGVTLPTGNEGLQPPLGNGNVDVMAGLVSGYLQKRWGFYGETRYHANASSGNNPVNDRLGYNLALAFRLLPAVYDRYPMQQVNVYLEFNGMVHTGNRLTTGNTGRAAGHQVSVAPGIQYIPSRKLLIELSVDIPAVRRDTPGALQPAYGVTTGIRWLLW